MSAFDRLQNYSARHGLNESSSVFNVKEPEGAFFNRLHQEGYSMYDSSYVLKDEFQLSDEDINAMDADMLEKYEASLQIDKSCFDSLSESEKLKYNEDTEFTELHWKADSQCYCWFR